MAHEISSGGGGGRANSAGKTTSSNSTNKLTYKSNDGNSVTFSTGGNSSLTFSKVDFFTYVKNVENAEEYVVSAIKSCDDYNTGIKEYFHQQFAKRIDPEYCLYTTDDGTGINSKSITQNLEEVKAMLIDLKDDCYAILREVENWENEYTNGGWLNQVDTTGDSDGQLSNEGDEPSGGTPSGTTGGYPGGGYQYPSGGTQHTYIPASMPGSSTKVDETIPEKAKEDNKKEEPKDKDVKKEETKTEDTSFGKAASEELAKIIAKIKEMDEDFTIGLINTSSITGESNAIWVDLNNEDSIKQVLQSISNSKMPWGSAISVLAIGGKSGQVLFGNLTSNMDNKTLSYKQTIYAPSNNDPPEEEKKEEQKSSEDPKEEDKKEEEKKDEQPEKVEEKSPNVTFVNTGTTTSTTPTPQTGYNTVSYQPAAPATVAPSTASPMYTTPSKAPVYTFESMDPVVTNPDLEAMNDPFRIVSEEPRVSLDQTVAETGAVNSEIEPVSVTPLEDIETYKSKTNAAMGATLVGGTVVAAGNIGYNIYKAKTDKDDEEEKKDNEG